MRKSKDIRITASAGTSGQGKFLYSDTSDCDGQDPEWIGCTDYHYFPNGTMTDFEVTFKSSECWSQVSDITAWGHCYDRDSVVGHELGHVRGLDHNNFAGCSIMFPTQGPLPYTESDPHDADARTMQQIYGS